ncbi:hypothetical protein GWI33_022129 [Rhynchophorus ferrugineus]|uniref:Uncharacterized protein n=1 Tax=Rhynchophorus ferrugineus TaxID=354439 RepID=A0A834HPC7_RHYFE|nr:hypothetical protein GWI33_022129 [Rhynchophorus ferrugineus]
MSRIRYIEAQATSKEALTDARHSRSTSHTLKPHLVWLPVEKIWYHWKTTNTSNVNGGNFRGEDRTDVFPVPFIRSIVDRLDGVTTTGERTHDGEMSLDAKLKNRRHAKRPFEREWQRIRIVCDFLSERDDARNREGRRSLRLGYLDQGHRDGPTIFFVIVSI